MGLPQSSWRVALALIDTRDTSVSAWLSILFSSCQGHLLHWTIEIANINAFPWCQNGEKKWIPISQSYYLLPITSFGTRALLICSTFCQGQLSKNLLCFGGDVILLPPSTGKDLRVGYTATELLKISWLFASSLSWFFENIYNLNIELLWISRPQLPIPHKEVSSPHCLSPLTHFRRHFPWKAIKTEIKWRSKE